MAKSKHSTALFEVMARSKASDPPAPAPGAKLWERLREWFARQRGRAPSAVDTPPPSASVDAPVISYAAAGPSRNSFGVDPDRRVVAIRLSYPAALVCALAAGTTVAAAYVAGRRADGFPRTLLSRVSTPQLQQQPPHPEVVDVGQRDGFNTAFEERQVNVANPNGTKVVERAAPPADGVPALQTPTGRKRTADLNYVIIQGYPEEAMARSAQALLAQNGIETTIERKLPNWATPNPWFSVVGVHGFSRITNSPELNAYVDKVKRISAQHHKQRSFKAFDPKPYKWHK